MISDSLDIEVPFYDVDSCDVVWHGHYLKYLERARCQLLDRIGYNYTDMRADGFFFPIIDVHIRYAEALIFAQRCRIDSELIEWENRLKIRYRIHDLDSNKRLTTAETTQVAVDVKTRQLCFESPPRLLAQVANFLKREEGETG